MSDVAPELLEKIEEDFYTIVKKDKEINKMFGILKSEKGTYKTAHDFSVRVGELLLEVFEDNLTPNSLPNETLYYNIVERVIEPMLRKSGNEIADFSVQVQETLNKKSKIGIKGIKPQISEDRIKGITQQVSSKTTLKLAMSELNAATLCFLQAVVDEAAHANADFQWKAGLSPKIIRTSTGHCCEWCNNLAGTYEYDEVSDRGNDVYRRHKHCRCIVEYDAGDGLRTNVQSKKTAKTEDIQARIENANIKTHLTRRTREEAMELQERLAREIKRKA